MAASPLLTAVYTGEPDEVYEFHTDDQARLFGRDDAVCDIVVWSAINSHGLSRVAGRIWRLDDELWVRNLSTRHELQIQVPSEATIETLPIRREDGLDRGPARSIPAPVALIQGPDGCDIEVRQRRGPADEEFAARKSAQPATVRLPSLEDPLRPVAVALCRPILIGGVLPAPYREVMKELGIDSLKRARNLVAQLCARYEPMTPDGRRRAAVDLDIPAPPTLDPD